MIAVALFAPLPFLIAWFILECRDVRARWWR